MHRLVRPCEFLRSASLRILGQIDVNSVELAADYLALVMKPIEGAHAFDSKKLVELFSGHARLRLIDQNLAGGYQVTVLSENEKLKYMT